MSSNVKWKKNDCMVGSWKCKHESVSSHKMLKLKDFDLGVVLVSGMLVVYTLMLSAMPRCII